MENEEMIYYRDHQGRFYINEKGVRIYPEADPKHLMNVSRQEFDDLKAKVEKLERKELDREDEE